jgi:hypothetical protein
MSSKRKRADGLIMAFISLGITSLLILPGCISQPQSRDEIIDKYLQSLENKDQAAIQSIVLRNDINKQIGKSKLQKLGGHQFENVKVTYQEIKPQLTLVEVTGTYKLKNKKIPFSETFSLVYERGPFWKNYQGQWFISLSKT